MTTTSDNLFCKEFRHLIDERKHSNLNLSLSSFTVPNLPNLIQAIPSTPIVIIKEVQEDYFSLLNNTNAQLVMKSKLHKRKFINTGEFIRNNKGNVVQKDVNVSRDCVAIISNKCIGLRRYKIINGRKVSTIHSNKFDYVDYIGEDTKNRKYIYILPKIHVYKVNMCALVLSSSKLYKFYGGLKLIKQDGEYVYLYVIPYNYNTIPKYRILGLKPESNFTKEIKLLLDYWRSKNYIFNFDLTYSEKSNLGIKYYNSSITENYIQYDKSLEKESKDTAI